MAEGGRREEKDRDSAFHETRDIDSDEEEVQILEEVEEVVEEEVLYPVLPEPEDEIRPAPAIIPNPQIQPQPVENPDLSDHEDSEDSDSSDESEEDDNQAAANMPAEPVKPGQLQTLPSFNGERGEGFITWLETLEAAKITYNWAEDALIQVAKAKGGTAIAEWDRGNRLRGVTATTWLGNPSFRELLHTRFGPKYTAATAVHAVADLKQKPRESCASFMDRVILAVNRQNYNITQVQKDTQTYKDVFNAAIVSHFGAGLQSDISTVVLGAADAPATVDAILRAAEAVEAETAKLGPPGASALAVTTDVSPALPDPLQDLTDRFEELVAAIGYQRRKPFDKTKSRCYNCNKYGHFKNECPEPRRQSSGSNRGGSSNRGRFRGNNTNAVEEQPVEDQTDAHHDHLYSGN